MQAIVFVNTDRIKITLISFLSQQVALEGSFAWRNYACIIAFYTEQEIVSD